MLRLEHRKLVDGRNRLSYHVMAGIIACVLTAVFWLGGRTLNQATATAAFVCLFVVMIIGPAMRLWWKPYLRELPHGLPFRWRGEFGVWFTILSILHVLLVWHGRDWQVLPIRHGDLVGLIALAWALGLAATSSGRAMKLLGIGQWNWLQATGAYVIFYLVAAHTLYHAWLRPPFASGLVDHMYAAMMVIVVVLQLTAFVSMVLDARKIRLKGSTRTLLRMLIVAAFGGLGFLVWLAPKPQERILRVHEWLPKELVIDLDVQTAFNADEIFFRFTWDQPNPGGWYHDMLVYQEGEWRRFSDPAPWMVEGRSGFYEDRLSFKLDDGSVAGFANFAGWLTQHRGVRSLPGAAGREEIEVHPWLGKELGRTDVRKYIPQSREGEWWEGAWDRVLPPETLNRLKADGVFLDLPMWRAHRSNALGYGTDHWILEHRHIDQGRGTYRGQRWDAREGPEFMFDPTIVSRGALDLQQIYNNPERYRQDLFYDEREDWLGAEEPYFLHENFKVPFDPDVAQWEGAVIPRQVLQTPEGSAAAWRARGIWRDGRWTVDMWRKLDTGYDDDKPLRPGRVYAWSPAVHHGAGERWHWVAYPYKLGLGLNATDAGVEAGRYVEVVAFEGAAPDWDEVPVKTIPLVYPGVIDWTWLTSERHLGYRQVREDAMSIWDWHSDDPEELARLFLMPE